MTDTAADSPPSSSERSDFQPRRGGGSRRPNRRKGKEIHGWIVLDKAPNMTSAHAVAIIKRIYRADKAGHAGTLDPLASGILPIALGDATKTVPYIVNSRKTYLFSVAWGVQTTTDDAEGTALFTSDNRPTREAIEALLPEFTGEIQQVPPQFSAIKQEGQRAYDLARSGETVVLDARPVEIDSFILLEHQESHTLFEVVSGKGTYVRSLARDLGQKLGCYGHIATLRRTRVGPFTEAESVTISDLDEGRDAARIRAEEANEDVKAALQQVLDDALYPIALGAEGLRQMPVLRQDAMRLSRGQDILLRGTTLPPEGETVALMYNNNLVALAETVEGVLRPKRQFFVDGL
jgi:tRNA pseudouridine55 synthase